MRRRVVPPWLRESSLVTASAAASVAAVTIAAAIVPAGASTPVVAPGQTITRNIRGFAPRAMVSERLVGHPGVLRRRADVHGVLHLRYRAPRLAGRYRLLLAGTPAASRGPGRPPVGGGPGDVQIVDVVVPRTLILNFVVGSGGVLGGTAHGGNPGPHEGGPAATGGGLASTGPDLRTPLELATLVLLLGASALRLGRRRRPSLP